MPYDKLKYPDELWDERRKRVENSLRVISLEELVMTLSQHEEEFVGNPSRDEFVRLMQKRPQLTFYHAIAQDDVVIYYCREADFGVWVVPNSGMGPLNETSKRITKEVIANSRFARSKTSNFISTPLSGLRRVGIPIALTFLTLAACKKNAEAPALVRPVRSVLVERHEVKDPKVASGHLRARDEVNLAFRIGGRIIQRKAGVGDRVQAGQTVALLDAEVERNARNSAQAEVAAAQAALDQSEAFEKRQKQLLTERVISPNEYDVSLRQLKTTQAKLDAVRAQLKSAEEQLRYTELKSDAAGVITETGADVGEVVPGGKMVLKVAQQTGRDAAFDVPAQAIRDGLSLGSEGEVWLADHPEIKANGKVREISPQADPVTRNYQVKVELADPPPGMFLGATVLGRLKLKPESLIEIPSSSLTMMEDKPAVWVVDAKNQNVHRQEITLARYAPDSVIVASGLNTGERVVTAGVQTLHEGQAVKVLGGDQ